MQRFLRILLVFGMGAQLVVACGGAEVVPGTPAKQETNDVVVAWYRLIPELIKQTPGWSPPVVARAFGYLGVAVYEAVVPGMPQYQSLGGQLNGLHDLPHVNPNSTYDWPTAAHAALAMSVDLFFQHAPTAVREQITALNQQQSAQLAAELDPLDYERSMLWGQSMALAVYTWSLDDAGYGAKNFPEDYVFTNEAGLWQPTSNDYLHPLQPYWGANRPFVLKQGSDCMPPAPPTYDTTPDSAYYQEAYEVYTTVNRITSQQATIALYWADDPGVTSTPPGHSISIMTDLLATNSFDLEHSVLAYAQLGIALADAFISGWYAKYHYNYVRPITFIQAYLDPDWQTIVDTPPFPEYPSGHSVQSGAAAVILNNTFGNITFTDSTHAILGMSPRSFNSFDDMAQEAAISRLYGGIHYRAAIEKGLDQGQCVAKQVLEIDYLR